MRYIISVLIILITFTACNKKEIVNYDPSATKAKKEKKLKIIKENNNTNIIDSNKSKYDSNISSIDINISTDINVSMDINMSDMNISSIEFLESLNNKVAIVYSSKKIGKYSIKVSDIVLAYSANENKNFNYLFFDIEDETNESINNLFDTLKNEEINNVMMYLTPGNLDRLYEYETIDEFNIYLPLINSKLASRTPHNKIIFGAISYENQLNSLIEIANSNIIEIYDEKRKNLKLHYLLEDNPRVTSYQLKGKYPNYKSFIRQHRKLRNASVILNLDIIKSSIFMSQISANDKLNVSQILATQSNYSPLSFVLSQQKDRRNLIVASSILYTNSKLDNINKLLGNDIRYDWVNYSTILGLELLKTKKTLLFDNIEVLDNQVQYPSILYKTKKSSFILFVNK